MGSTAKKKDFRKKGSQSSQKGAGRRGAAVEQRQARKKAGSKATGKATGKAGRKATGTGSGSAGRSTTKKAGSKATASRKPAGKTAKSGSGGKSAPATKKGRKGQHGQGEEILAVEERLDDIEAVDLEESLLTIDDIDAVDDLLDPPPAARVARKKPDAGRKRERRGPKTPTVPRTVKPTPKEADLELDGEVMAFIAAIDKYRHQHSRPFPTWAEIFYVFRELGYRK